MRIGKESLKEEKAVNKNNCMTEKILKLMEMRKLYKTIDCIRKYMQRVERKYDRLKKNCIKVNA